MYVTARRSRFGCFLSHHCGGSTRSVSSLLLMLSSILPHGPQHPHPSLLRRVLSRRSRARSHPLCTFGEGIWCFWCWFNTLRTDRWYLVCLDGLFALKSVIFSVLVPRISIRVPHPPPPHHHQPSLLTHSPTAPLATDLSLTTAVQSWFSGNTLLK